jgi:lipoate synthase
MTYKGVAKGKIIELEEALPYSDGQAVSVSVEALRPDLQPGSAPAILKVMRGLPDLNPHDVEELERLIREGRLPVRMQGEFEKDLILWDAVD